MIHFDPETEIGGIVVLLQAPASTCYWFYETNTEVLWDELSKIQGAEIKEMSSSPLINGIIPVIFENVTIGNLELEKKCGKVFRQVLDQKWYDDELNIKAMVDGCKREIESDYCALVHYDDVRPTEDMFLQKGIVRQENILVSNHCAIHVKYTKVGNVFSYWSNP
jgi:hypothetical protein